MHLQQTVVVSLAYDRSQIFGMGGVGLSAVMVSQMPLPHILS